MTITLEFDDRNEALVALHGRDAMAVIMEVRDILLRGEKSDMLDSHTIDAIRDAVYEIDLAACGYV